MIKTTWTLAFRKRTANRFQRVTNWSGTWAQARELAFTFSKANPELAVYYVPTLESEVHGAPEDAGNVLVEGTGKRIRIRDNGILSAEILAQVPDADEAQARFGAKAY